MAVQNILNGIQTSQDNLEGFKNTLEHSILEQFYRHPRWSACRQV